jgi:effector-binding domain-containing protein
VSHDVVLGLAAVRPTAVVAAATTWAEFHTVWQGLSAQVWACLRAGGIERGCPNVMLYLDDVPNVEIGVLLDQPCPLTGRVVASSLPGGPTASTVHRGPYSGLPEAHRDVVAWCDGEGLRRAGPSWEIYGPHREDPAELTVEIHHLLAEQPLPGRAGRG